MRDSHAGPTAGVRLLVVGLLAAVGAALPAGAQSDTLVRICRPTNPPQCTPPLAGQYAPGQPRIQPEGDNPYFEFMVEAPARLRQDSPRPAYPPLLREAGVAGEVFAQFVVDTTGRVEASSLKVLRSTHELFTASVRAALETLRYTPARVSGRPVRQLVQETFVFGTPRDR